MFRPANFIFKTSYLVVSIITDSVLRSVFNSRKSTPKKAGVRFPAHARPYVTTIRTNSLDVASSFYMIFSDVLYPFSVKKREKMEIFALMNHHFLIEKIICDKIKSCVSTLKYKEKNSL